MTYSTAHNAYIDGDPDDGPEPEPDYDVCHEPGCANSGIGCFLPSNSTDEPDYYYCFEHAHAAGFCFGCGTFWGGIESFEFNNPSGVCDNCRANEERDDEFPDYADYPDDYDPWDAL